ncbi:uncharacterized protein [Rutidosis leptorrhynchoides]|uniref:uncharacterized protein n=1 Tax=Rutidosis leptorrhynchoides TaxID=125765 RepID=UPI003A9A16B5
MCEVLNRWLVDARDKPIITALEYVREYLMKRIVNVLVVANKKDANNQILTPNATKLFEANKKDASKYTVLWNGRQKYQVNGLNGEQVVVDLATKECACRRWEITGMPCKHAIAALYNRSANNDEVEPPEQWVHPVYMMSTWRNTYAFSINPVNGRSMWPKSTLPFTLIPPKIVATAGRPKKNRRKGLEEKDNITKDGKLSKKGKQMQCSNCKEFGHNKRGCKNEGVGTKRCSETSGSGTQKKSKK